jgi:hypothetical protein
MQQKRGEKNNDCRSGGIYLQNQTSAYGEVRAERKKEDKEK